MVIEATRKPADNKEKILSDGLKILGLKPIAPIYKVCHAGSKIEEASLK